MGPTFLGEGQENKSFEHRVFVVRRREQQRRGHTEESVKASSWSPGESVMVTLLQ